MKIRIKEITSKICIIGLCISIFLISSGITNLAELPNKEVTVNASIFTTENKKNEWPIKEVITIDNISKASYIDIRYTYNNKFNVIGTNNLPFNNEIFKSRLGEYLIYNSSKDVDESRKEKIKKMLDESRSLNTINLTEYMGNGKKVEFKNTKEIEDLLKAFEKVEAKIIKDDGQSLVVRINININKKNSFIGIVNNSNSNVLTDIYSKYFIRTKSGLPVPRGYSLSLSMDEDKLLKNMEISYASIGYSSNREELANKIQDNAPILNSKLVFKDGKNNIIDIDKIKNADKINFYIKKFNEKEYVKEDIKKTFNLKAGLCNYKLELPNNLKHALGISEYSITLSKDDPNLIAYISENKDSEGTNPSSGKDEEKPPVVDPNNVEYTNEEIDTSIRIMPQRVRLADETADTSVGIEMPDKFKGKYTISLTNKGDRNYVSNVFDRYLLMFNNNYQKVVDVPVEVYKDEKLPTVKYTIKKLVIKPNDLKADSASCVIVDKKDLPRVKLKLLEKFDREFEGKGEDVYHLIVDGKVVDVIRVPIEIVKDTNPLNPEILDHSERPNIDTGNIVDDKNNHNNSIIPEENNTSSNHSNIVGESEEVEDNKDNSINTTNNIQLHQSNQDNRVNKGSVIVKDVAQDKDIPKEKLPYSGISSKGALYAGCLTFVISLIGLIVNRKNA